jgi:hypothetical protein
LDRAAIANMVPSPASCSSRSELCNQKKSITGTSASNNRTSEQCAGACAGGEIHCSMFEGMFWLGCALTFAKNPTYAAVGWATSCSIPLTYAAREVGGSRTTCSHIVDVMPSQQRAGLANGRIGDSTALHLFLWHCSHTCRVCWYATRGSAGNAACGRARKRRKVTSSPRSRYSCGRQPHMARQEVYESR